MKKIAMTFTLTEINHLLWMSYVCDNESKKDMTARIRDEVKEYALSKGYAYLDEEKDYFKKREI